MNIDPITQVIDGPNSKLTCFLNDVPYRSGSQLVPMVFSCHFSLVFFSLEYSFSIIFHDLDSFENPLQMALRIILNKLSLFAWYFFRIYAFCQEYHSNHALLVFRYHLRSMWCQFDTRW